jgi:formylglycine-generating enzyme required for sulfatase activity
MLILKINFKAEVLKMKNLIIVAFLFVAVCAIALTPAYKICTKCGKVYQLEYNYCPDDGSLLVQIGETETSGKAVNTVSPTPAATSDMSKVSPATTMNDSYMVTSSLQPQQTATPVIIKTDTGEIKQLYPSEFGGGMKGCSNDMVYIAASSFNMGSKSFPFPKDAKLVHSVFLDSYCIDKYEYPNKLFTLPASEINYQDASKKCAEQGKRLCTEAEWEKACKGPEFFEYPYGKKYEINACRISKDRMDGPKISGEMEQCVSKYGVFDMSGNVAEWVSDYYDEKYYYSSPQSNPKGPDKGTMRVIKGGSWVDFGLRTKCSYRDNKSPDYTNKRVGFRCCKNPE